MSDNNVIELLWMHYRSNVIPAKAREVQLYETRKAFYSGARALFQMLKSPALIDEDTLIERVDTELEAFAQKAGVT